MSLNDLIPELESRPAGYVLLSADGTYRYKGSCRNLVRRMQDHHAGRVSKTKNRRPLSLLHIKYFDDYTEARRQEPYFKSGTGRAWL